MAKIPAFLESILAAGIGMYGEPKLVELLTQLHTVEGDNFETDLRGSHNLFTRVLELAKKSPTHIDDAMVQGVLDAIEQAAELNNIKL